MPPLCLSLGERALFVQAICEDFPLRGEVLRRAAPLPAGAVCGWARGSRNRLPACEVAPVASDADCAPLCARSGELALVCCCMRPCGAGSRAVASGLVGAAFAVLACLSTAVPVEGCCKLMLLAALRCGRAVASGLVAIFCRACSCAGCAALSLPGSASARGSARRKWGEEGLYLRAEAGGCCPLGGRLVLGRRAACSRRLVRMLRGFTAS